MELRITVETAPDLIVVTTFGTLDPAGAGAMMRDLLAHPAWGRGLPALLDHTASPAGGLSAADVQTIARMTIRNGPAFGPVRLGLVLGAELDYGLGRMWESLIEGQVPFRARVFRSRNEARAWLLTGSTRAGTA